MEQVRLAPDRSAKVWGLAAAGKNAIGAVVGAGAPARDADAALAPAAPCAAAWAGPKTPARLEHSP